MNLDWAQIRNWGSLFKKREENHKPICWR